MLLLSKTTQLCGQVALVILVSLFALTPTCRYQAQAVSYPVGITNCGLSTWINGPPQRAITMNQGTTEVLLALGLADRTIGTAYLDDEIWGELASVYAQVPVLSDSYPGASQILQLEPDFLYASYSSAFALSYVNYTEHFGFDDCDLVIQRSDGENRTHCRQELQEEAGIATYLQSPFCELVEHRPETLTIDVLMNEIWEIATIFDVLDNARILIDNIQDHFDQALDISKSSPQKHRVLWIDSFGGDVSTAYVGACCGAIQVILEHAGAVNVFADRGLEDRLSWDTVTLDEVIETDPDLIVIVDASWDTVEEKLFYLCSNERIVGMRAVQNRAFITVPFSGSTLGVRIGSLAYNLAEAIAALDRGLPLSTVDFSSVSIVKESGTGAAAQALQSNAGVKVYTVFPLFEDTNLNDLCPGTPPPLILADLPDETNKQVVAAGSTDSNLNKEKYPGLEGWAVSLIALLGLLLLGSLGFLWVIYKGERRGKPMFTPKIEGESA